MQSKPQMAVCDETPKFYRKQNYLKEWIICNSKSEAPMIRVTIFTTHTYNHHLGERRMKTMSSKKRKKTRILHPSAIYSCSTIRSGWQSFTTKLILQVNTLNTHKIASWISISYRSKPPWMNACFFHFPLHYKSSLSLVSDFLLISIFTVSQVN